MSEIIDVPFTETVNGGWNFRGSKKGGGGGAIPMEWPDTLHSTAYARVLDLVSEGEIYGLVNGLQSVYLDGTPIENTDGTRNFERLSVDFRLGTQHQDHIAGFPAYETSEAVGVELKYGSPWVKYVPKSDVDAVRMTVSAPGLQFQNPMTGQTTGWRFQYGISVSTDGGPYQEIVNSFISGKTTSTYARTHRLELPKASQGWQVKVSRLSADSVLSNIQDKSYVQDISYVVDGKLRHPNSALVGITVDAKQFSNIPTRSYHLKGLIISVPDNYDPVTRTYNGIWSGERFKQAYTNNPAWIFYDMLLNGRYGLGRNIKPEHLRKHRWDLYIIGQYCDQMVDDGFGGKEPRFTCNAYFQQAVDAYRALTDIASIFRGLVYWGGGSAIPVADMPKEYVYTYTDANVVGGDFTYTGTPLSKRFNVVLVSWNDPTDMYRQKVEVYEYRESINRYGINKTEVSAFGCTSRGQAKRLAKWIAITSSLETRGVSFSVGLEGTVAAPGQIIRVADQSLAGRRIGGRIRSATKSEVELDSNLAVRKGDKLTVILPSGVAQTREVVLAEYDWLTADSTLWSADTTELTADMDNLPQTVAKVTVSPPFSVAPEPESIWTVESETLSAQTFRVISVKEGQNNTYQISAWQHVPEKFEMIDNNVYFDPPPITVVPPKVQPSPQNVRMSNYSIVSQGVERINARIEWDQTEHATEYEVQWRRDGSDWVFMPRTGVLSSEIDNAYMGDYEARVRAINPLGVSSPWAYSNLTALNGTMGEPPVVTSLDAKSIVFGIELLWSFPDERNIIDKTELWVSKSNNFDTAEKLGDFSYPQNRYTLMGLGAGQRLYFWVRLVDKNSTAGEFYPKGSGILGTASHDATEILDYLAGEISETQLGGALLEKIESAGGAITAIEQIETDLAAMITLKAQYTQDGVPYMAGIGVGVENNEGVITSQILLAADRVAILDESSGELTTPFVVQGGQVLINEALIGKLSANHIKVNELSELTENAGTIVSGKLRGKDANSEINLNAKNNENVINFGGGAMTVTANGHMKINSANVIDTLQLSGRAVTTSSWVGNTNTTVSSTAALKRDTLTLNNVKHGDQVKLEFNASFVVSSQLASTVSVLIFKNDFLYKNFNIGKCTNIGTGGANDDRFLLNAPGLSFTTMDVPGEGNFSYSMTISHNAQSCTCTNSAITATIYKR